MGCLARIGCLALLVLLGVIAWLTRDSWMPGGGGGDRAPAADAEPRWELVSDSGAERTRRALLRLSEPTGPVYVNVTGADAASFVYAELARRLPPSADSIEAAVVGDRLLLRAFVQLRDLGGPTILGPIAGMLGDRERLQLGGTLHVVGPELAEYRVRELRVRELALPRGAIPRLLQQMDRVPRPDGVSEDGLPFPLPRYLGDMRVANGRITLYRTMEEPAP